jgi:beta-N-acetylhexosaminidase
MSTGNFADPLNQRELQPYAFRRALHTRQRRWPRSEIILGFAIVSCFCFAQAKAQQVKSKPVTLTKEGQEWVEETLKGLSLEEKVGQMLQIRCFADYPSFAGIEYKYLRDQLQKYGIGSVVLGMHFNRLGPVRISPPDAARVANRLQTDSKLPLLIAADLERGVASRFKGVPDIPWPMAFGAADNTAEVERFAAITAREARAVGIQWALAPVADVNSNPANPVINDRSFGEDPGQVCALVAAFIRGAHENGLLVTAKHFPGNGDTSVDSHHAVASIDGNLDHLQRVELPPFRKAIEWGVDAILLAHARVPALEPDPERITTVSAKVVTEVLKDQLGFKGVVLTDALEMPGLTRLYDPQKGSPTVRAALDAIKAGCDVIMLPTELDRTFHAIIESVRSGQIPEARIDESVRKVLKMKASVGLNKVRLVDLGQVAALTGKPEDMAFAQRVADEAVTLVRDNRRILPLQKTAALAGKVMKRSRASLAPPRLAAIVLGESLESSNGRALEKALKSRRPDAQIFYFDGRFSQGAAPQILNAVSSADRVVVATFVTHRGTRQVMVNGKLTTYFGLLGPSGHLLQQVLAIASEKTAVVALGSPYLIASFPEIQTYVCTYAMASTSETSAVKALFGEVQSRAKLPITLPGIAPRGFSLPWLTEQIPQP